MRLSRALWRPSIAVSILVLTCCGSRSAGKKPTCPPQEVRYVPQPAEQCIDLRGPERPPLTCAKQHDGTIPTSCDPKIDAARMIDYAESLDRWKRYVHSTCDLDPELDY